VFHVKPLSEICLATAREYGITPKNLLAPGRRRLPVEAQYMAMYLARGMRNDGYTLLGENFGLTEQGVAQGLSRFGRRMRNREVLRRRARRILEDLGVSPEECAVHPFGDLMEGEK
jgi:chromosomal replication initiation ATPase DnaA